MKKNIYRAMQLVVVGLVAFGIGAQAQVLKPAELKQLTANAKTAADHQKLAAHYNAKALEYEATAKEHEELAKEYELHPTGHDQKHPMMGQTAAHCRYFAEANRKAAAEARELAKAHEAMAKQDTK
jgi:3-hydroxy-3-methylglutaryl CoA synthase